MTIAIVGGGISGLSLAHALGIRGRSALLFESSDRLGGVIRSARRDGFITEAGPNAFVDHEPATRDLLNALNLTERIRFAQPAARRRFVYARGALRELPASPPAFLKSDVLPILARLRVLAEVFCGRGRDLENESLESFGRRHLGSGATRVLVDAMQSGIYAGDPRKLSVAAAFPRLVELERAHRSLIVGLIRSRRRSASNPGGNGSRSAPTAALSGTLATLEGGLETVIGALGERLGDRARCGAELTSLAPSGAGWRLTFTPGSSLSSLEVEHVVLAVPPYVAATLIRGLDRALADELDGIEYAPVAVVHLGFRRADLRTSPEGFGFLVPAGAGLRILGAIFVSSIFPWRAPEDQILLTCMAGGARSPERANLPDDALFAQVREDLLRALRIDATPSFQEVVRWKRAIPQYNIGHLARIRRIAERASRLPGLTLSGNAYRGVGINDCIRQAASLAAELEVG